MINLYTDLDEISFIAGTKEDLEFEVYNNENQRANLSSISKITWTLALLGDKDNPILTKTGEIFNTNCFRVSLTPEDTINLRGKFIHQPILKTSSGVTYRPAEGLINIVGAIKE